MSNNHEGVVDAAAFAEQLDLTAEVEYAGKRVRVHTQNSIYEYDDTARTMVKVYNNGRDLGYTEVGRVMKARIDGATFGGSMIKPGVLLPDAYMEFVVWDKQNQPTRLTSSLVSKVEVVE